MEPIEFEDFLTQMPASLAIPDPIRPLKVSWGCGGCGGWWHLIVAQGAGGEIPKYIKGEKEPESPQFLDNISKQVCGCKGLCRAR